MPTPSPAAELAVRRVRMLIADTADPPKQVLRDGDVAGYLELFVDDAGDATMRDVRLAAATALEAIAVSEVLTSKVIRNSAGVSSDGAKVSSELRARANDLRAQVERDDAQAALDATGGYSFTAYGDY